MLELAHAEKWINVGAGKHGITAYVDSDSAVRMGDIATINLGEPSSKYKPEVLRFDCVKRLEMDTREPIEKYAEFPMVKASFDIACKRWYEIWK